MARPVAADAEATKGRILAVAKGLVSARGIDGTSVRDIAGGARVSLATVLHYFGSKEGLYGACIDSMYDELAALQGALLAAVQPGRSGDALLADVVGASWRFVLQHTPANRLVLRSVLDRGGLDPVRIDAWLKPSLDVASNVLAPLFGISDVQARLGFQSMVHLLVRYSLHSDDELLLLTRAHDVERARDIVCAHITDVARGLFMRAHPSSHRKDAA